MRTASMILGLIGGIFAILFAILFVTFSIPVKYATDTALSEIDDTMNEASIEWEDLEVTVEGENGTVSVDVDNFDVDVEDFVYNAADVGLGFAYTALWVIAAFSALGGILGIIGGSIVRRKNIAAGVLMLIACVPSFFTGFGAIASILLILGGIFALVKEKTSTTQQGVIPQ